jgi:hypothetical protein
VIRSSDFPKRYRRDLLASLPDEISGQHRLILRDAAVDDIYCMMRLEGHWLSDGRERSGPNRFRRCTPSTRVAA